MTHAAPSPSALHATADAPLRVVDSITELGPHDAGCVAVSGSHGGLSSARYALAARPLLSIFNDAGVGLRDAGIAALDFLQQHNLAACTVAHHSACIGQAHSTWQEGTVAHTNAAASALGIAPGMPCHAVVHRLCGVRPDAPPPAA